MALYKSAFNLMHETHVLPNVEHQPRPPN